MKKRLQLLTPLITTCLSFLMLSAVIFAWFSMNNQVGGSGMSVTTEVSPDLVISNSIAGISTSTSYSTTSTVSGTTVLVPCTHETNDTTNLKYNTNPSNVDSSTGLAKSGSLAFENVPVYQSTDKSRYYIDFTYYIAATNADVSVSSLTATISEDSSSSTNSTTNPMYNATTIDFYFAKATVSGSTTTTSDLTYIGKLNIAGSKNSPVDSLNLTTGSSLTSPYTIPLQTTGYVIVVCRCYFDGALTDSDSKAYVNSSATRLENFKLNVSFTGVDAQKAN